MIVGMYRDGLVNVRMYEQANECMHQMPFGSQVSGARWWTSANDVCAGRSSSSSEPMPEAITCLGIDMHAYINVMTVCDSNTWLCNEAVCTHTYKPDLVENAEQDERPVDVGDLNSG